MRLRDVEMLPEERVQAVISRTPPDQFVVWDGNPCISRVGSLRARALALVEESWTPMAVRDLLLKAAHLEGTAGLDPELVRSALRLHQSAHPTVYFLVRRSRAGDFLTVTDVPWPYGCMHQPIRAGTVVLDRWGVPQLAG